MFIAMKNCGSVITSKTVGAGLTFLLLLSSLTGCPEENPLGPIPDIPDVPKLPDAVTPTSPWTQETIATGDVGRHIRVGTIPGDMPSIVYFATDGVVSDELCTEIGDDEPPLKISWDLSFAWLDAGTWSTELIQEVLLVGPPAGLDYKIAPDGTPSVATMIGEPVELFKWCGANDAGLLQRQAPGSWSSVTAAAESADAPSPLSGSDFGSVVGVWPGLAFDGSGNPVVAYKDTHGGGGLQSIDYKRADLELAWGSSPVGGSWSYFGVDQNKGAGNYNQVVFDKQGRIVITFHNPTTNSAKSEHGLWATRSDDGGVTWERVQINEGQNLERPSVVVHPDSGEIWIAYFNVSDGLPYIARNTDPANFESLGAGWEIGPIGDNRFREGAHPSIAVSPDGRVGVAYYRCGRPTDSSCDPGEDAVVFAWWEDGEWTYEVVDEGEAGLCGMSAALAFKSDGSAFIGYQCAVRIGSSSDFTFEVRVATRKALP